jgi:hypothetical protein
MDEQWAIRCRAEATEIRADWSTALPQPNGA